jgi:hypothetical protein
MYKPHRKEYERDIVSHSDVKLTTPRDPSVWKKINNESKKDFEHKIITGYKGNNWIKEYIELAYKEVKHELKANLHVTIGRRRL